MKKPVKSSPKKFLFFSNTNPLPPVSLGFLNRQSQIPFRQAARAKGICRFLEFVGTKNRRVFSKSMVAWLNMREGRPWMQLRKGKEIDELWLAQQLAPYGIRPRSVRIDSATAKGYMEEDFKEVFQRYVPRSEIEELQSGMRQTEEGQ